MQEQVQPSDTKPAPWAGFRYAPVRGLVDRQIARFLRTQRKNMRRFFLERGHLDLFAQLDELRKEPHRDFRQKNVTFQRILNEHIARSVPDAKAVPGAVTEAEAPVDRERGGVDLPAGPRPAIDSVGDRPDAGVRVPELAAENVGGDGVVIEE